MHKNVKILMFNFIIKYFFGFLFLNKHLMRVDD